MRLEPLGDQAVMAYCEREADACALAARCRRAAFDWLVDVVQAYLSVAVFYAPDRIAYDEVAVCIRAASTADQATEAAAGRLHVIPCCYELGLDWPRIVAYTGRTVDELIALHSGTRFTVYAIGFCPGFPYMGYLPAPLAGVPRLESPRLRVEAGSVGLTGRQTGIYTEERPGGWNIVGRTPLELVNVADGYFPLATGDQVQFQRIGIEEFERRKGERLSNHVDDFEQWLAGFSAAP